MTISRKEFYDYHLTLGRIEEEAQLIRRAWPWQRKRKNVALNVLYQLTSGMRKALVARVSKPRKKPEPMP